MTNYNRVNLQEMTALDTVLTNARRAAFKARETLREMVNTDPCEDNMLAYSQADSYYRTLQSVSTKVESVFNIRPAHIRTND